MALTAVPGVPAEEASAQAGRAPLAAALHERRLEQFVLRAGLISTGIVLLSLAFQTWQGTPLAPHVIVPLIFIEYGIAFAMLAAGVSTFDRLERLVPWIGLSLLFAFVLWAYMTIHVTQRTYGTDNAALSQVAAERLIDGENPYAIRGVSVVETAAARFGLPRTFITYTTDGRPLDNLMSWPAGSVLALVPGLAVGVGDVRWVTVVFEILTFALVWSRAPAALRPLAAVPLMLDSDMFLHFTAGGVMDFLWVAPVVAAAIALYERKLGWAALLYGLAAGTKQQPWLLAPFLAVWVWNVQEDQPRARRVRAVAEFGAIASVGFLMLNLPFMAWDFPAWVRGVLLPLRDQEVSFGSGISVLTQVGIADLPKSFYTLATFGIWGLLLLIYMLHFRTLKHVIWLAPAIIMWFAYRSLQNYFIYWSPVLLIALLQWWDEERRRPVRDAGGT